MDDARRYAVVHPRPLWAGGRPGPASVIGRAGLLLLGSGIGAAVLGGVVIGVLIGLGSVPRADAVRAGGLVSIMASQALLLWFAVRRGRRLGDGCLQAGLGWQPVRRRRIVAALVGCAVLTPIALAVLVIEVPGVRAFALRTGVGGLADGLGWAAFAAMAVALVIGAPVAEEVFFRGWLWAGLRQSWGVLGTSAATGALFLLLHLPNGGWRRAVMLLPLTVMLSLARELGGSVRASIAVHLANNAVAVAVLALARLE